MIMQQGNEAEAKPSGRSKQTCQPTFIIVQLSYYVSIVWEGYRLERNKQIYYYYYYYYVHTLRTPAVYEAWFCA
jgi:hypothetical protein